MKESRLGFKAFKIDIHHILGIPMQQYSPSIGPREAQNVALAYELARKELSDDIDIIVHCHNELDVPSAIKVAQAIEPIMPLFYEDPIAPGFSEGWMALRRATNLPIMTGESPRPCRTGLALPATSGCRRAATGPDQCRRYHRHSDNRRTGRTLPYPGLSAQCRRLWPQHGIPTVVGSHIQLSVDGKQREFGSGRRGDEQHTGHQRWLYGNLYNAGTGNRFEPGIHETGAERG
jgi:hypothetical protein